MVAFLAVTAETPGRRTIASTRSEMAWVLMIRPGRIGERDDGRPGRGTIDETVSQGQSELKLPRGPSIRASALAISGPKSSAGR